MERGELNFWDKSNQRHMESTGPVMTATNQCGIYRYGPPGVDRYRPVEWIAPPAMVQKKGDCVYEFQQTLTRFAARFGAEVPPGSFYPHGRKWYCAPRRRNTIVGRLAVGGEIHPWKIVWEHVDLLVRAIADGSFTMDRRNYGEREVSRPSRFTGVGLTWISPRTTI